MVSSQTVNLRSVPIHFGPSTRPFWFREGTSDESVIQQVFVDRHYDLSFLIREPELDDLIKAGSAKGRKPLIVDAGANIGASPLYFLSAFPTARVVAIEPDTGNFELLVKNTEGTGIEGYHAALASMEARVRVVDPGQGNWGYRTELVSGEQEGTVPCVTIGGAYARHSDCFPFLVKIDIEGAEAELFSANTEWVARTPVIVIELHDWLLSKRGTSRAFLKCVAEQDRDFIYQGENVFSVANNLSDLI